MLPQKIESLWTGTSGQTNYPELKGKVKAGVAIIGGGIAGLNAAYYLTQLGYEVTVIEAGRIATGTSGNTTAKITSQHELKYTHLKKHFRAGAKLYAESNQWAIGEYKRIIDKEAIKCDFRSAPAYTYVMKEDTLSEVEKEVEIAKGLGLPASFVDSVEGLPFAIKGAVKFDDQAFFHPRKYLLAVAEVIKRQGGHIYEKSRVTEVKEGDSCIVRTDQGSVAAKHVIVATNYPIYDKGMYFTRLSQMRSYALAAKLENSMPEGMFINIDDLGLSFRPHIMDQETWYVIGGEDHVVGEESDSSDHYQKLEQLARERFNISAIDFKWAAQDSVPADRVPYIGRMPLTKNIYVTTGYAEWGMTTSLVSGRLLADLIDGKENEWAGLYDPSRIKPVASAKEMAKEGIRTAKGVVRHLTERKEVDVESLMPEEGKIFTKNGEKLAVSKDKDGNVKAVSAVCTHLGCIVAWNNNDKSWDCPCHGSRFKPDGEVITGPAFTPLEKKDL